MDYDSRESEGHEPPRGLAHLKLFINSAEYRKEYKEERKIQRYYRKQYGKNWWTRRRNMRAEERYYKHLEEEEELIQQHGGLHRCPVCGEFSVKITTKHTRNYGGGTDTFYKCQNLQCEYAEVCV